MTDTGLPPLPPMQFKALTMDFVMGQMRIALVGFLAYGGGKGWFTPQDAGLFMVLFSSLGPVVVPWIWSIVSNIGVIHISTGSAAAVVAQVEATDKASANAGAVNALIATSGKAAAIALICALSLFAFPSPSSAQIKLTGNIGKDFAPKPATPSAGVDGAVSSFSTGVQKIEKDLVDRGIADLNAAITDATNHNDNISLPCWQANLRLLQSLPSQWETPPSPIGIALGIQIQRDLLNAITGNEATSLKVACAALWGDQLKIVANVGALIGIRVATGGLF